MVVIQIIQYRARDLHLEASHSASVRGVSDVADIAKRVRAAIHLDIDIACRLVLAAVQPMTCSWLIEDCQCYAAWLCTGLVHHISVHHIKVRCKE